MLFSILFLTLLFIIKIIVMQKTTLFTARQFLPAITLLCILASIIFQGCEKSNESLVGEEIATKRKPQNPPPPPPPFYFSNCNNPLYSAQLTKGTPANVSIIK